MTDGLDIQNVAEVCERSQVDEHALAPDAQRPKQYAKIACRYQRRVFPKTELAGAEICLGLVEKRRALVHEERIAVVAGDVGLDQRVSEVVQVVHGERREADDE